MAELYAGRNVDPEAMYQRMKGLMDAEGLPYGRRTHTYSSRLAQELGKWADTQPGGAALHEKLYQAYFVEARNIGDPDLLGEVAPIRGDRGPDLCRRRIRRGRRPALRSAGAIARPRRCKTARLIAGTGSHQKGTTSRRSGAMLRAA